MIVSLLLFAAGSTDYYIKRELPLPNLLYALLGIMVTALLCALAVMTRGRFEKAFITHKRLIICVTLLVFFLLALIICIGGFFFSDWDPAAILYGAYGVLHGNPEDTGVAYFSNHPNNLLLVWIYLSVLRLTGLFGVESVLALVIFQCMLSSLSAFIFFRILEDMTKDPVTAYLGLIAYEIWIVLSPWFIITYSDETGMIVPLLLLRVYQRMHAGKEKAGSFLLYSCILSVLASLGYFIKPQIALSFVAVLVLYVFEGKDERPVKRMIFLLSCAMLTLLSAFMIKSVLIPSMGIETDGSKSFGMPHYFMMGLNSETDGAYSDEDTLYTDEYDTPAEKGRADMERAYERIKNYGAAGLAVHSMKKTLVNFSDGLFAWGVDGDFFAGRMLEDIDNVPETAVTKPLWSIIRTDGAYFGKYAQILQIIWITVLILGILCGIAASVFISPEKRDREDGTIYAVMLSLILLFMFELLFEAKARYLIIYLPYYLLTAVYGLRALLHCRRQKKER